MDLRGDFFFRAEFVGGSGFVGASKKFLRKDEGIKLECCEELDSDEANVFEMSDLDGVAAGDPRRVS